MHQQAAAQRSNPEGQSSISNAEPVTEFHQLGSRDLVHPTVVKTLTDDMHLDKLTQVQTLTINEALKGVDVVAQAKTGTGKTLAFLIPILQNIISVDPTLAQRGQGRRGPRTTADDIRALIISPTRELAEQIAVEARRLTSNTGVIVQTAVGGTQKMRGLREIQQFGCHVLVGTPGRLKDILTDPYSRVEAPDLSALVFDEADRLLDQGFWPEIQEIMRLLPTPAEKDRQTMMFSATIPKEVVTLVRSTLKPGFQYVKCVQDDEDPTHQQVRQHLVTVKGFENALPALVELCAQNVEASQAPGARPFKAIVYFNSTAEVALANSALSALQTKNSVDPATSPHLARPRFSHPWPNVTIQEIHSRLSQQQRTAASENFRRCNSGILVSSDVTARGMDFPNVTHVIQVGLPSSREQYVHRIGRTARAGKEGEAWLILNEIEAREARSRLRALPIQANDSLELASLDFKSDPSVSTDVQPTWSMFQAAMKKVPIFEKTKVYLAQLGVYSWFPYKDDLIRRMNDLSKYGWGMDRPPLIPPSVASRLRLTGIPGVEIGHDRDSWGGESSQGARGGFGRSGGSGGRESRFGGRSGGPGGYGGSNSRFGSREGGSNSRSPAVQRDPFGRSGSSEGGYQRGGGYERREPSSRSFAR